MQKIIQAYKATEKEFKYAEEMGARFRKVINKCGREGYIIHGWFVWEASGDFYKCIHEGEL